MIRELKEGKSPGLRLLAKPGQQKQWLLVTQRSNINLALKQLKPSSGSCMELYEEKQRWNSRIS